MTQVTAHPRADQPFDRHRFTSDDFIAMIDANILGPDDKVELLQGEIIDMSPTNPAHSEFVDRLLAHFSMLVGQAQIRVQGTTRLSEDSVLDPDLMLLKRKPGGYRDQLPTADDILFVIEVADSSLRRDRDVKSAIYAAAGITDYWIIDLTNASIIVHRKPTPTGYNQIDTISSAGQVAPIAFPEASLVVQAFFA